MGVYKNEPDPLNRVPRFCSKCSKKLKAMEGSKTYDTYTGEPVDVEILTCPTLSTIHDLWKREELGAWVNYAYLT
jgi:hypothetical protein